MKHRSKHNDLIDNQTVLLSRPLQSRVIVLMMVSMMQHKHTQRPCVGIQDPGPGCGSVEPCQPGAGPQPQDPGQRGGGSAAVDRSVRTRTPAHARGGGGGAPRSRGAIYIYGLCIQKLGDKGGYMSKDRCNPVLRLANRLGMTDVRVAIALTRKEEYGSQDVGHRDEVFGTPPPAHLRGRSERPGVGAVPHAA